MIKVGNRQHGALGIYVGRPSPLGNPFHIGLDGNRPQVINKYRNWLDKQLENTGSLAALEFARIRRLAEHSDVTLVCWCAPLLCHADVIKEKIEQQGQTER